MINFADEIQQKRYCNFQHPIHFIEMSRLCVKNIGKGVTEKQLKEVFSSKGEVTDVKVMKTQSGTSRNFAFVGFRTDVQASDAVRYFNNTFIGSSRIAVEIAKKLNDESLEEIKRKNQIKKNPTPNKIFDNHVEAIHPTKKQKTKSSKMEEFMAIMKPRSQAQSWGNDESAGISLLGAEIEEKGAQGEDDSSSESSNEDDSNINLADKEKAVEPVRKVMSDLDYLKSKQSSFSDSDTENDDASKTPKDGWRKAPTSDINDKNGSNILEDMSSSEKEEQENEVEHNEPVEETGRLFVKNLPFTCTEDELSSLFSPFGLLSGVHIPLDSDRKAKGIGFVQFLFPEHASKACNELNGTSFQGRVLRIELSKPMEEKPKDSIALSKKLSSFQQKKEEERRKNAGKNEGWNASFVRSDTVVAALADR